MKICCTILMFFFLTQSTNRKGIDFFDGTFKEALALSGKTGKPVFINFYASWCGPCKQLKKSYKDDAVGIYYNRNFVAIAIDGEKRDGPELMQHYGITSYPTLLIVDKNGKRLAQGSGYMKPYILINFGKRVVP